MQRRTFLKASSASGFLMLISPKGVLQAFVPSSIPSLTAGFLNPPPSAKPGVFYLYMNGNISAQGITKDLEALSEVGIGGVLNYNAGVAIPKGPVRFLSDEWYGLLKHTLDEADRLGMEYAMHNCPGWSSSGGPWVTPEMSMQTTVWSENMIEGGRKIRQKLAKPLSRLGYYEDSLVVAFPSLPGEQEEWKSLVKNSSTNNGNVTLNGFTEGNGIELIQGEIEPFLQIEFKEPYEIDSFIIYAVNTEEGAETIHATGPFKIETSDNGDSYQHLSTIGSISSTSPGHIHIEPRKVKYLKIITPNNVRIEDISFYAKSRRLADWMVKTNAGKRPPGTRMIQRAPYAGEESQSIPSEKPQLPVEKSFFIDKNRVIDLTGKMNTDGVLEWDAPAGNWTILRFGHTTTGVTNRAAPENGQGLECDKFSKSAFDQHFDGMLSKILPLMKSLASTGKAAIEIDSYEVGMQNWTKHFQTEFEKSRNYSLIKYMPAFTGRVVNSINETESFLWDARRVMADLMAENYYGRCAERCHENGLLFYGEPYKLGPMEGMQAGSRMDNVMGEFWARGQRNGRTLKLASSVQHLNGKKIIAAEAYTGHGVYSKWQQYPFSMKAQGDYMFTQGLTRIIFHTSAHQPHPTVKPGMTMGPFGTHIDRNVTWFHKSGPWLQYIARCQFMLQQGLFVADLLYYIGEDAPGEEIGLKETPLPAPGDGIHYDYINTEILLNKVIVKDRRITLPDGMSYSLLILPPISSITIPVLEKLKVLISQGARIMGNRPTALSGLSYFPEGVLTLKNLSDEIWGTNNQADEHLLGKGKVIRTKPIATALKQLNIQMDFTYTSTTSDAAINYIHRKIEDVDVYFIANRKRRFENLVCSFRISGKMPEIWNADTGLTSPITVYDEHSGRIDIPIHLQPSGSLFVVFKSSPQTNTIRSIKKDEKVILETKAIPVVARGKFRHVANNFSQTVWIKPESDIAVTGMRVMRREDISSFAFSPSQGELLYGKNHAISGMTAGRNGIVLYERLNELVNSVYEVPAALDGWTHVALVYENASPKVYVNGNLAGEGTASKYIVHPCVEEEYQDPYSLYFEGDSSKAQLFERALSAAEIKDIFDAGRPGQDGYPPLELFVSKSSDILIWENGKYAFEDQQGKVKKIDISNLNQPVELRNKWNITFPEQTGAPLQIEMLTLSSLHKHSDPGVKYFSGTANYTTEFDFTKTDEAQEFYLDLGQVEVIAEVKLNGIDLGIVWQKPYRMEVTQHLISGKNTLSVNVTNLWPNRLIGDEQYPEENEYLDKVFEGQVGGYGIKSIPEWFSKGLPKPISKRTTFSTWKHFEKDHPLLESGLIGPVQIFSGIPYVNKL